MHDRQVISLENAASTSRKLLPNRKDDLFLCCASYEERTATSVRWLDPSYQAVGSIVYVNKEFLFEGSATRHATYGLVESLARISGSVTVAEGSLLDPLDQLQALRGSLLPYLEGQRPLTSVTIDATTFNREALLVVGTILASFQPRPRVTALYTTPRTHGSWLSRGVRKVRNVIGLGGAPDSQKPTALILLSGFEGERALRIIDAHEPVKLLVGMGDPPTASEFLSRNVAEQKLVLARQEVESFTFPATHIDGTYKAIEPLVLSCSETYNVVLAPMSTKLSTLAALRVGVEHPDVQVTYCVPGEYNLVDYSTGAKTIYVEDLFDPNSLDPAARPCGT